MDNRDNLWTRRSNTSKLSLTVSNSENNSDKSDQPSRAYSASKRLGGESSSHGSRNPFNAISPLTTGPGLASPTAAGSSAFGLGSGAFASFGSVNKTPKTPGTAFEFKTATTSVATPTTPGERKEKSTSKILNSARKESLSTTASEEVAMASGPLDFSAPCPLKYTWVIWYRPPTSKNSDYEKSTKPLCRMSTAQEFWKIFVHLNRPSTLPTVSDYHFFKEGIRPVWEDDENKRGGKWIMRLKKGVADRYWEELLMALIGDQFLEAADEVCGFVLSVRSGEDVFSIWTKNDGGRNIKIRETVKRVLGLPEGTIIIWRSHDESIAQRTAIDQARQDKTGHHGHEKRRVTSTDESLRDKSTSGI
ncbi:translation initiation factor eIF 4e-like domain-containing protein [Massariosphaeria phaeospora]|uniref:Translation initiation factor eIF 4e-like domain-containing protein n=1 Tax=Massariosphaeria phaeospora TaxID=100035 RepID=A0A7C8M804_9PLEO|nr:translation initiation factor eIF 4e-like domain-containing protein [Massariosphaeria phaeospora]